MRTCESSKQISLFALRWKPQKGQPMPWDIKQKLCKPKGGRNKKGDFDNFHNRDYDFVSPGGEVFTGKGIRRFAQEHGLCESALRHVLDGKLHSYKGWTKAVGGRKLPVPPTYYFLSPSGEVHATTSLSEFARQHDLCPIALSRISRCIRGAHKGWRHCTPGGQPIVPQRKHRKFTLLSPTGEIVEGSNLKAFAEQHGLSRGCLMNVLDGTSKEHKGWKLPVINPMTTTAHNLGQPEQFKIGDRVEFLSDVNFGDINSKAKNPDAKLALKGECAEVCGVRGTGLALSVGGEPFDWPIRLVRKISDATLEDSHSASYRRLALRKLSPKEIEAGVASFTVGDRVQIIDKTNHEGYSAEVVEEVSDIRVRCRVYPTDEGDPFYFSYDRHHLIKLGDFKVGDRVRDTFGGKSRTGTIADTREKCAVVHWDGVNLKNSPNGQQWSYEYLEKIEDEKLFTNEDEGDAREIQVRPKIQSWTVTDEEADAILDRKWCKPRQSKPILPPDAPIAIVLFAGGGGVEAGMVEAGIRPVVAVEFDPKKPKLSSAIADCHDRNFGEYGCKLIRKSVQEISELGFPGFPKSPDFLHASPMCSNFSNAKAGDAVETDEDIEMARSVAIAIRKLQPKFFTLENVKRYRNSQSFKIIASCLEEEKYIWQGQIMTLLDCQARERFVVVASVDWLPPLPDPIQPSGWYEAISDLIPKMEDSELVAGQNKALEKFLASNEPTPLLIERTGARGEYRIKPAHLPCNTLRSSVFTDGKGRNRNKFADIWLPDGSVKSVSIKAAARLQGFPDWYEFPPDVATAGSIIGYSVPPKFAAQLFKSLQQSPPIELQIQSCLEQINQHNWHIQNLETEPKRTLAIKEAIHADKSAIASELERINQLLEELIIYRQLRDLVGQDEAKKKTLRIIADQSRTQPASD